MIAQVPNPDAARPGDGASGGAVQQNARGPQLTMVHGVPLAEIVKHMGDAGIPQNLIRQYVNDAMAGKNVPPHTSFTAVARNLTLPKKGPRNAKTP